MPAKYTPIAIKELWEKPRLTVVRCSYHMKVAPFYNSEDKIQVETYVFYAETLGVKDLGIYYDTIEKYLATYHELRGMQVTPNTEYEEITAFLALQALAR